MILEWGRRVLLQEGEALLALSRALSTDFERVVDLLLNCSGRVICCGVGKSGHVARKAAGTFSSTGTPSLFLHASEAVHGDLGVVASGDLVLLYTHSGETDEIVSLFPSIKALGGVTVCITGRVGSSAARLSDFVLDTGVKEEVCPHNLAPTSSTTAMMALSDALAITIMQMRGFSRDDFAKLHPSGSLGKRLLLTVEDVMRPLAECALVGPETPLIDVMSSMTKAGAGAACIHQDLRLLGLISDGDLRRHFLNGSLQALAGELGNKHPTTIEPTLLAIEALEVFQNLPMKIGEIPVVSDGHLLGLLVLKDLLRSGIV